MQIIFSIIIVVAILGIAYIFIANYISLKKRELEVVVDDRNIVLFKQYCMVFYKFIIKKIVKTFKFFNQYTLHILVRVLYFINMLTDKVYAKSRDTFVSSATKNRSTVTHFWSHLKVYKREIDKEKED